MFCCFSAQLYEIMMFFPAPFSLFLHNSIHIWWVFLLFLLYFFFFLQLSRVSFFCRFVLYSLLEYPFCYQLGVIDLILFFCDLGLYCYIVSHDKFWVWLKLWFFFFGRLEVFMCWLCRVFFQRKKCIEEKGYSLDQWVGRDLYYAAWIWRSWWGFC